MFLVFNYIQLFIVSFVINITICDWVEIPQVTTNRYRDQNFYRLPTTTTTSTTTESPIQHLHRHYTIGTSQNFKKNSYGNFETNKFVNNKNGDSNTQIGRPEVTTERWSETTMNLEDLVNDALYNLKNPIVTTTTTTEQSSRIMMLTTSTTEIPPPLSVTPTIPTTRQEETGFDDENTSFEDDDENEYYDDDVYVTTAFDDSDELQSSKVGAGIGDDFNKILSTIEKSTPKNIQQEQEHVFDDIKHHKKGTKDKVYGRIENDDGKSSLFSSMAGFLPLLKDIQETLTKNNKQTTSSKVELLENIRDELLTNINYRMNALWNGGDINNAANRNRRKSTIIRERRDARTFAQDKEHDDHHHDHHYEEHEYEHHVDFPSNAAALLALSFLTFAVFLIKLVLQVIQALQVKAQNMTTTTTSATIIRLKRSEDEEYENAARILNYIDTFSIK